MLRVPRVATREGALVGGHDDEERTPTGATNGGALGALSAQLVSVITEAMLSPVEK